MISWYMTMRQAWRMIYATCSMKGRAYFPEVDMTNPAIQTAFDAETYLAWEERQVEKHEYIAGEVFAMAGARREHVVVS